MYIYGKTGPGTAEHKLLRSLVGEVAVFFSYKMFVPRVILKMGYYVDVALWIESRILSSTAAGALESLFDSIAGEGDSVWQR